MPRKITLGGSKSIRQYSLMGPKQQQEAGSVLLIVVGIVIPVFLGFAMLAIDLSRLALIRGELQNSADAAALYGAELLMIPDKSPANAQRDTLSYVLKNEAGGTNPNIVATPSAGCVNPATKTWTSIPSSKVCIAPTLPGMRLTIRNQTTRAGFAQVFYIQDRPVRASAAAVIVTSGTTRLARLLY
jgi:uncharacterized membrane protein